MIYSLVLALCISHQLLLYRYLMLDNFTNKVQYVIIMSLMQGIV